MRDSVWQEELGPLVRTQQIIVGALVAGCIVFAAVVTVLPVDVGGAQDAPIVTYVAIAFAVMTLMVRAIVPSLIVSHGRKKIAQGNWPIALQQRPSDALARMQRAGDAGKVWMLFSVTTIVAAALIEGATFFLLIAYLIEHSLPALVTAIAMMIILALHMPTRARAFAWVEDQLALVEQVRNFGS